MIRCVFDYLRQNTIKKFVNTDLCHLIFVLIDIAKIEDQLDKFYQYYELILWEKTWN